MAAMDDVGDVTSAVLGVSVRDAWVLARLPPAEPGPDCPQETCAGDGRHGSTAERSGGGPAVAVSRGGVRGEELWGLQDYVCVADCGAWSGPCFDNTLFFLEFSRLDNHYRLLQHLARRLPDGALAVDLGSHAGGSAYALAGGGGRPGRIRVVSYDVADYVSGQVKGWCR
jgi:hypothetical protein